MLRNRIYYSIAFMLFITLKFAFLKADNEMLQFMLKPISLLITFITNNEAVYDFNDGYFHRNLNIIIDKSCSGINFWLIGFMVCVLSLISKQNTHLKKIIAFPLAFILSYILTLFANTSRILTSIFIENNTSISYSWLHQAQGVFIYLFFLIIFYLLINYLLSKSKAHHAKLT
nr:exosortase K [uncultured Psychroserpens sp.]